jgi:hypothetical protein
MHTHRDVIHVYVCVCVCIYIHVIEYVSIVRTYYTRDVQYVSFPKL